MEDLRTGGTSFGQPGWSSPENHHVGHHFPMGISQLSLVAIANHSSQADMSPKAMSTNAMSLNGSSYCALLVCTMQGHPPTHQQPCSTPPWRVDIGCRRALGCGPLRVHTSSLAFQRLDVGRPWKLDNNNLDLLNKPGTHIYLDPPNTPPKPCPLSKTGILVPIL